MSVTNANRVKIAVLIPAYNEAKSIRKVILELLSLKATMNIQPILLNDDSTDKTLEVISDLDIVTLNHVNNLGIGGVMQSGYLYCKSEDFDIAIQFDGDGQHSPAFIEALIEPIIKHQANMAIGSRYLRKKSYRPPPMRALGIFFLRCLLFFLFRKKVSDPTSGFRAVDKSLINFFAHYYPSRYPESESLGDLILAGYSFKEIPVEMLERTYGKSSIRGMDYVYYLGRVSLAMCLKRFFRIKTCD